MKTSKIQYYMGGMFIISFCLMTGYSIYIKSKYDKTLEALLICSTTYYGNVDERLINENSEIRNNLKENNVENNVENNEKKTFINEVCNDIYKDLVKEAESKQGNSND